MKKIYDEPEYMPDDQMWENIFSELDILNTINKEDIFRIDTSQICKISNCELDALTKIRSSEDRCAIFNTNDLTVIQNGNNEYVIGNFDAYIPLEYQRIKTVKKTPDQSYEINTPLNIKKESDAILNAFNYNIFQDILDIDYLKMVDFGHHKTKQFSYSINLKGGKPFIIDVPPTQINFGGVFESLDCVLNVEANINSCKDFFGKQIYYSYRALSEITNKPIYNILLTATTTGSICVHTYEVNKMDDYNSIKQVGVIKYDFFEPISITDVHKILDDVELIPEPNIVFPQADSVDRIFQTIDIVKMQPGITAQEIGNKMNISGRQGGYYSAACVYLDLLHRRKHNQSYRYYLTDYAEKMSESSWKERNLMMIYAISRHLVFYHFIKECLDLQEPPSKKIIIEWLENNIDKLNRDSETTSRRANTVSEWVKWVIEITAQDDC